LGVRQLVLTITFFLKGQKNFVVRPPIRTSLFFFKRSVGGFANVKKFLMKDL
jgi:hypothetical protein